MGKYEGWSLLVGREGVDHLLPRSRTCRGDRDAKTTEQQARVRQAGQRALRSCCQLPFLHLTTMSSVHDPMEIASIHAPPPAMDHDVINIGERTMKTRTRRQKLQTEAIYGTDLSSSHGIQTHNERNFQDDLECTLKGDFKFSGDFALSETFVLVP